LRPKLNSQIITCSNAPVGPVLWLVPQSMLLENHLESEYLDINDQNG